MIIKPINFKPKVRITGNTALIPIPNYMCTFRDHAAAYVFEVSLFLLVSASHLVRICQALCVLQLFPSASSEKGSADDLAGSSRTDHFR